MANRTRTPRPFSRKLIQGVGINDAPYSIKRTEKVGEKYITVWECPFYKVWRGMLKRCYSVKFLIKHPWYSNVRPCEEWLTFSNFRTWMEQQDWEGKDLDKDLFGDGYTYSPECCIFLDPRLNTFIACSKRGTNPLGAFWHKGNQKYQVMVSDYDRKSVTLGYVGDPMQAHKMWLGAKIETMKKVIDLQTDGRIIKRLSEIKEKLEYCYDNNLEVESLLDIPIY